MQIPDYCEALVGYRVWRVAEGGLLTGVYVCEPWAPKVAHRASCQKRYGSSYQGYAYGDVEHSPHLAKGRFVPAPVLTCFCGLWGTRTEADLFEAADSPEAPSLEGFAWGTVSLWGRVIEHTNGWRAELAYPKALSATSEAAQIAALYGVPCKAVKVAPRKKSLDDEMGWFIGPRFVKTQAVAIQAMSSVLFAGSLGPSLIQTVSPDEVTKEISAVKQKQREERERWRHFLNNHRGVKRAKNHHYKGPVTLAGSW